MATTLRLWLFAAALGTSWLLAQTGGIAGKITDAEGGFIPGVTVTARSEGRTRTAVTNATGEYSLDQLQPGRYRVEATLAGFTVLIDEKVVVEASRTTSWNAKLKVAGRREFNPFADFQARVKQLVGPDAVDCGQHRLLKPLTPAPMSELEKSLACGLEAAGKKRGFWMSFQLQGIDSTIFYGVAGTADGTMFSVNYDSAPCGGPGCEPSFSAQACAKPSLRNDGGNIVFIKCS